MTEFHEKRDALIAAIHREESPGIIADLTARLAQLKGVVGQALGLHYDAPSEAIPTWQKRSDITRKPEGQVERSMQAEIDDLRTYINNYPCNREVREQGAITRWSVRYAEWKGDTSMSDQEKRTRCMLDEIARLRDALADRRQPAIAPAATPAGWVSVDDRLPECSRKKDSFGVEVIIYPKPEKGESTAFFGCRITATPDFYKYGSRIKGVTHWMPLPSAPTPPASPSPDQ